MNWEQLGDLIDEIGEVTDRAYRIGEYRRLLTEVGPGEEGHAELLTCLGDDLKGEGHLEEAWNAYQSAIDDGGRTVLSPYSGLLDVAVTAGDEQQTEALLAQLLALSRADSLTNTDCEWIGETFEQADQLKQALRWFTIPLRDIQPGDIDLMPIGCLNGRWRVRRELGLPIDAYDDAHDVWHEINAQKA